ncbi:hypothetical protein GII32_00820 [Gordonia amarae]|nr:hypothetical protein GII32_00820 [Gordonia amarae]
MPEPPSLIPGRDYPVTDTGPGLPGSGLRGMADRAASVGGTLTAGPTGGRWHVRAVLPR